MNDVPARLIFQYPIGFGSLLTLSFANLDIFRVQRDYLSVKGFFVGWTLSLHPSIIEALTLGVSVI